VSELRLRCIDLRTVQDGLDPLVMLETLHIRHSQYEQYHKIIRTPESIGALKLWPNQVSMLVSITDSEEPEIGFLPQNGIRFDPGN
jgi:hypothetical protein